MEFRCVTQEERPAPAVESSSLSDVLALAQKLQAESDGLVNEEQVVEMGRELGVRPEYVRAAIRRHRRAAPPARRPSPEPAPPADHHPVLAAAQALLTVFAVLMLPLTAHLLTLSGRDPVWILAALAAAWVAGWSSRQPRLAGIAGASALPMILFVSSFYREFPHPAGIRGEAILYSILSLGPLCAAAGEAAGRARRRREYPTERERMTAL
jgi:hypothetical protein